MNDARWLQRALDAEDEAERLKARIADLESRLRGVLNTNPTTAVRALAWVGRAEQGEKLLSELLRFIDQRAIDTRHFPGGWVAQAHAQVKAVEILKRDLAELAERPDDDYWETIRVARDMARSADGPI